jgi:hypothetical protein
MSVVLNLFKATTPFNSELLFAKHKKISINKNTKLINLGSCDHFGTDKN